MREVSALTVVAATFVFSFWNVQFPVWRDFFRWPIEESDRRILLVYRSLLAVHAKLPSSEGMGQGKI